MLFEKSNPMQADTETAENILFFMISCYEHSDPLSREKSEIEIG